MVKSNKGAGGVDGETLEEFEKDYKNKLYKIWNRMSSGSYFPPAVKTVEIPKSNGGKRRLGIPTVADRIAQMVVKLEFESKVEPYFHEDSYGYRPGKSAVEAVGKARTRSWRYNWVIDMDIKGFFDNIDHELMMKAVRKHTECKWELLYIERWLKAEIQEKDGARKQREKGTPQGGVISPLLANLFLHYAFDKWMEKKYPQIKFERYADDIVVHCSTEAEAKEVLEAIKERLKECKLEIHEEKTRIVYCKDEDRRGKYPHIQYDFLGYTFRPRLAKTKRGRIFFTFTPSVSEKAKKKMREIIRYWRLYRKTEKELKDLAEMINPVVRGWINYYGKYRRSGLYTVLNTINMRLVKWARRKYKRYGTSWKKAMKWLSEIAERESTLFVHWVMGPKPMAE